MAPWEELRGFNCPMKPNPVSYYRHQESAQSINRGVNDLMDLVPLHIFIGSWKHQEMPWTIISDQVCLMSYTATQRLQQKISHIYVFLFSPVLHLNSPNVNIYATSLPKKLCSLSSNSVKWYYLLSDSWLTCSSVKSVHFFPFIKNIFTIYV